MVKSQQSYYGIIRPVRIVQGGGRGEESHPTINNLGDAYDLIDGWERAQIKVFGRVGKARAGDTYVMYAVTEEPGQRYSKRLRHARGSEGHEAVKSKPAERGSDRADGKKDGATGNKWTDDGRPICRRCGGAGHMEVKCAWTPRVSELICSAVRRNSEFVLLDLGAEASLFRDDFYLDYVRALDDTEYFKGAVGSESLPVHHAGFFGHLPVLLSEHAQVLNNSRDPRLCPERYYPVPRHDQTGCNG